MSISIKPTDLQVIVYHCPCIDGTSAAYAAYSFNPNFQFIGWNLNTDTVMFDEFQNTTIGFFDCAPTPKMWSSLFERNNQILVVDHHIGNKSELSDKSNCVFDMEKSGGMLAWEYFFPTLPIPLLIWHIGKRDLWDFTDPDTRIIGYGLIDNPAITYETLGDVNIEDIKTLGLNKVQQLNDKLASLEPTRVKLDGTEIVVADIKSFDFSSECAEYLYEKFTDVNFVCVYFKLPDDKFKLSFRTNKDNVNLSIIAKQYGGGGHAKAAGATVQNLPFS